MRFLRPFLQLISLSRISIFGSVLVTSAFSADVLLILGEILFFESHPYIGIVAYMIFPGIMATGLALIPCGIWWRMKKLGKPFSLTTWRKMMELDLIAEPRRIVFILLAFTLVFLVAFSLIGYRSFHYTESREFCGSLCHSVMAH